MEEYRFVGSSKEQRITELMLLYWNELRGEDRRFPSYEEVTPETFGDLWENCFVVEVKDPDSDEGFAYHYIGEGIKSMFGGDMTGAPAMQLIGTLSSRYSEVTKTGQPLVNESEFIAKYSEVAANKKPLVEDVKFTSDDNVEVRYRQVLLPLGPHEDAVTHILGAMRYKLYDPEAEDR